MPSDPVIRLRNDATATNLGYIWANSSDELVLEDASSGEKLILGTTGVDIGTLTADAISLPDTSTSPGGNGDIRLNGTDVEVGTGGGTVNLSDLVASTLAETIRDELGATLQAGTDLSKTVDDPGNTVTLDVTASGGSGRTDEEIQDLVAAFIEGAAGIDDQYDDANGVLNLVNTQSATTEPADPGGYGLARETLEFERYSGNPIIEFSNSILNGESGSVPYVDLHFPTVIRTDNISGTPLGDYHAFWGPHDGGQDVVFAYADDPQGPWTEDRLLGKNGNDPANEVGESSLLVDPNDGTVWHYFNSGNGTYSYRTSPNGYDSWTSATEIFDYTSYTFGHVGYKTAFRNQFGTYLYGWEKRGEDQAHDTIQFSPDGVNNWRKVETYWYPPHQPTGGTNYIQTSPVPLPQGRGFLMFHTANDESLYYGYSRDGWRITSWGECLAPTETYEGNAINDPCALVTDDDRIALYYAGGGSGNDPEGVNVNVAFADVPHWW
jgi:hypothetical protein